MEWWHKIYILDYVVFIVFFAIGLGAFDGAVQPFDRYLPPNDPTVAFPERSDTVPSYALYIIHVIALLICLSLQFWRRSLHDAHHCALGFITAVATVNLITNIIKTYAGRYRPDWYSTFAPDDIDDGRFSFPSGHSSNTFMACTYLVLYFCGTFKIFNKKTNHSFALSALVFCPFILCTFVAVSRTRDYKHNFSDILAGSLIGIFVAMWCYFVYYPPLSSKHCGLPKVFERASIVQDTELELRKGEV